MAGNRLSHTNQPAPMPRDFNPGAPHPEIIRNVDGRHLLDRNVAEPFGPGDDGEFDGDEMQTEY